MSIFSALRAGVSGLNANSSALASISDNIANVGTNGYKRAQTEFSALLGSQNVNASVYVAGGVTTSVRRFVDAEGPRAQTQRSTDLAIAGQGFFAVTDDEQAQTGADGGLFTRSGSFSLNSEGRLVNSQGYTLLGAPITRGGPPPDPSSLAALRPINLAGVGASARASTQVGVSGNLDARLPVTTRTYANGDFVTGASTPDVERTIEIIDSLGTPRSLTLAFQRISANPNQFQAEVSVRPVTDVSPIGTNPQGFVAAGVLEFDSNGALTNVPASLSSLNIPFSNSTGAAAPQALALDLSNFTQFAAPTGVSSVTTDGSLPGDLTGLVVARDGTLTAQFSNGQSQDLFLIPVATFLNPNGLQAERGAAFRITPESGDFTLNTAGQAGAGLVQSNTLEESNVDLGTEFSNLIITQRAYSASSQIIRTADELLQELINIPQ